MRKYVGVVLVFASLVATTAAADNPCVPVDQELVAALAQAVEAPVLPFLAQSEPPFGKLALCQTTPCVRVSDCYASCGGPGSSYCERSSHRCLPF